MNIIIIAAIFIVIMIVIAGFIAQQFYSVERNQEKKPKSLMEKMQSKGLGALDTGRFKEIVMSAGNPQDTGVEELVEGGSSGSSQSSGGIELPEEAIFEETMPTTGQPLNLAGKDLQTIYSEYLTQKNINPFDVEPDFKLGVAYLKFAQFEKAQNQFLKVIDEKPEFPGIYYHLGESYRCNGQFYEAMKAFKKSWEMEKHWENGKGGGEQKKKEDVSSEW